MAKKIMNLINLTPKSMSCGAVFGCPAVYQAHDDTYIIIGKLLNNKAITAKLKKVISPGEVAIEVPKELINKMERA